MTRRVKENIMADIIPTHQEPAPQQFVHYIETLFAPEDDVLRAARAEMERHDIPLINVSTGEGKFLHLLARGCGAKRILEIGTLGGYSTIWLARALPADGTLISLELDPHRAEVARHNLDVAGLSSHVEVRLGPAADALKQMAQAGQAPFDLVFIDADKESYPQYLELSLPLLRGGGVMLADNALSHATLDPNADEGIDGFNARAAAHPALDATIATTLGASGRMGGILIAVKKSAP